MIVDVHAHIVPPEILGDAASPETWRPRLVDDPASRGSGLELAGRRLESVVHEIVDADRIVSTLAGFGVDYAILSPFVSLLRYAAPADQCLASSQAQNDGIAAVAHQRPNRVAGLGTDDPVGEVRAAKLSAGAEASVLGGNAVALFRLPG